LPSIPRDDYPWWVKATIKESMSRRAAWFWFGLSALFGLLGATFFVLNIGFFAPLIAAIGGPIVAVLYLLAIKWMDRHGEWPRS
jgi:amino acid permease